MPNTLPWQSQGIPGASNYACASELPKQSQVDLSDIDIVMTTNCSHRGCVGLVSKSQLFCRATRKKIQSSDPCLSLAKEKCEKVWNIVIMFYNNLRNGIAKKKLLILHGRYREHWQRLGKRKYLISPDIRYVIAQPFVK
ncbi:hypothetical protein SeMB42_g07900 [Synchytrium endobioticum]|uniref:Uncharacterized protein n=1 Tax=Synchytrium endobioticum TaxID=286115 RepID=A0A507BIP5_9FUNG|nr:hypothetical protein SeMB42_g07900 [Synchytrium endobioticum]